MMKLLLHVFILAAAILCSAAEPIQLSIIPQPVIAGEPAELIVRTESLRAPAFTKIPQINGLEWLGSGTSTQYQFINGKATKSAERKYSFIIEKPGTYTIPAAEVKSGNDTYKTKPLTFNVEKAVMRTRSDQQNKQIEIDKAVFSQMEIPSEKRVYYVGEYIPVEVIVYSLAGIKFELAYPEIQSENDNIIFRDYRDVNPQNPRYDRPTTRLVRQDGQEYVTYRFRTEVKAIAAGKLTLASRTATEIQVPANPSSRASRDPFFDSFFDSGFFSRTVRHTAVSRTPEVTIKPLPESPANLKWLGLVGKWTVDPVISSVEPTVGSTITLSIRVTGNGGLENLKAPELKADGFRIYSPEITREPNGKRAVIRYIIIPVRTGTFDLAENFGVFNSETGKYEETPFRARIKVSAAESMIPALKTPNVVDTAQPESEVREPTEHALAGIMYLKKLSDSDQAQSRYCTGWVLIILLSGIIFLIVCEIVAFMLRGTGTAAKRKAEARKQKKKLMKHLQQAQSEQVCNLSPEIAEYLNNALDLSPGTSLDEIAESIVQTNPELSGELKNISAGTWAPGAAVFSEERKQKLMKLLGKIVCILLCFAAPVLSAAPADQNEAIKAYDNGKFAEARNWYTQQVTKNGVTPALLYNIGNCFYQEKQFGKALICYERAHLLAPRDMEIMRNLELTRRELLLPAGSGIQSPAEIPAYLRDQLTPEEWLILGSIGLWILLIVFGLRRFGNIRLLGASALTGALILIVSIAMFISAHQTTYNENRAIVIENGVSLSTLPSKKAPVIADEKLRIGESVEVRESRSGWIRIKAGNAVGWVPMKTIGCLNGNKFSVF